MLEFARRGYDELDVFTDLRPDIALGVGVIDIKDNEVESPDVVAWRIEKSVNMLGAERVRWVHFNLPKFEFENYEQVLEARHKLSEQLSQFRNAMASLAAEIDESPFDSLFLKKIENILASETRPAVQSINLEIQRSRDTFIIKCLRNAQTGSIPIVALIFAGLPPSAVIALSAGLMSIETALETCREIKHARCNSLSLLLG